MPGGAPQALGILSIDPGRQTSGGRSRSSPTSKKKKSTSLVAAGRRARPAPRRTQQVPVLPMAVALVLLAIAVAIVIAYRSATGPTSGGKISGISCDTGEHVSATSDHHYHAHLEILYQGTEVSVPAQIGIPSDAAQPCFYWLHTHDTTGVIHIEAPAGDDHGFTLGQFFDIWGQKLSGNQVAYFKTDANHQMKVWVDGQPYTGNPRDIVLKAHEQIVIEVGPGFTDPPPTYTFPSGL